MRGLPCAGKSAKEETPLSKKNIKRYANGFEVHDLAIGQPDGKAAQAGQRVTVEYIGSLQKNGKVFDQSKSFAFRLGRLLGGCTLQADSHAVMQGSELFYYGHFSHFSFPCKSLMKPI